jgi:hypothetical protein
MNNNTKYLLLFLIVMFGLVIIYDSLTKFGMFEGLENQSEHSVPLPEDKPTNPPATPDAATDATPAPDAPPATAAPEKKEASSTKKTPVKTFSF